MKSGCYYCLLCTAVLVFIGCLAPLASYPNFKEHTCNITRIEYPTQLPTNGNTNGWTHCDCGRYCQAWTTCIRLYSSVNPDLLIQSEYGENEACTFVDDECQDGEDLRYSIGKLNEVQGIVDKYDNNEVNCYYDEGINTIYLDKDYNDLLIILPSIFLGIMLLIGCYIYCKYSIEKRRVCEKHIENL